VYNLHKVGRCFFHLKMPELETHVEGAGGDIAGGKLVLLDETAR
jgi:hypothetical protein